MNLTQRETPSNSQRTIKRNDLLRAAEPVRCEEKQELKHVGDLSAAAPAGREGKPLALGPRLDVCLPRAGEVCRKLSQAQQGSGRTETAQPRKGAEGGEGRDCLTPGTAQKQFQGQVSTRTLFSFRQ